MKVAGGRRGGKRDCSPHIDKGLGTLMQERPGTSSEAPLSFEFPWFIIAYPHYVAFVPLALSFETFCSVSVLTIILSTTTHPLATFTRQHTFSYPRHVAMNGIKADPDVKMDPDALTPSAGGGFMDDEFYEDTG